jgi:perosamine synthetase
VEVFGNMAHFDAYERIARSHGLKMIEDCCEALGGRLGGRSAGQFGDGGVFAYYPNKQITTGEGGMIVTDNDDVADLCRSMRNQGRDTKEWLQHARLGYNYRMSEITAALGAMQAARLDEILAKRRRSAELYQRLLAEIEEIHLPPMAEPNQASWFVFVIRLADRFSPAQRDELMQHLRGRGISCNPYFVPIHLQPYIQAALGTRVGQFPVTERVAARTIALPFFNALTEPQVLRIKAAIQEWLSHAE